MRRGTARRRLSVVLFGWVCLWLLGWAIAGGLVGHTCAARCDHGGCQTGEDAAGLRLHAAEEAAADSAEPCLACRLLRCLRTVTVAPLITVPRAESTASLEPAMFLAPDSRLPVASSARSPPRA